MAKMKTALAWRLWQLSCRATMRRYGKALREPIQQQTNHLQSVLKNACGTKWQKEISLPVNACIDRFREIVPIQDPESLATWTERIAKGEQNVLSRQTTERLIPTSGTTGPRKLIPMNRLSRHEFTLSINAWIGDLLGRFPNIRRGRCYIATSPAQTPETKNGSVPIGFAEDHEYLSPAGRWILKQVLAVPSSVTRLRGDSWKTSTRKHLLEADDLSFVSIWHPSYWSSLFTRSELDRAQQQWPELETISSWADGPCEAAAQELMGYFPRAQHAPKGLWLTEGAVSIPWRNQIPLALLSGFMEFEDAQQNVWLAHELKHGESYRPIITNHAGLYRYRIGDMIQVDGFVENTPSIRWIGRADNVSDLCGEKLSEAQVAQAFQAVGWNRFALLAPNPRCSPPSYVCLLKANESDLFPAETFEEALNANPHYKWARDVGQLDPISKIPISEKIFSGETMQQIIPNPIGSHIKASYLLNRSNDRELQEILKRIDQTR